MDNGMLASRYAHAIFFYARKNNRTEETAGYFRTLLSVMETSPSLEEALNNPVLNASIKEKLLQIASGAGDDETFCHTLHLILANKRENYIRWIALHYNTLYKQEESKVDVNLTTAVPVDKDMLLELSGHMENILHKTPLFHNTIDSSIIGGYKIEWDTYRYDTSVKKRLQQIKKQMISHYDRTDKN